jgi:hypothetical protein
MLIGADGRPDVSPPTPEQFERRFLQKLAGADKSAAVYVPGYADNGDGLDVPTRNINTNQYYLPGVKLQNVLNNFTANLAAQGNL